MRFFMRGLYKGMWRGQEFYIYIYINISIPSKATNIYNTFMVA